MNEYKLKELNEVITEYTVNKFTNVLDKINFNNNNLLIWLNANTTDVKDINKHTLIFSGFTWSKKWFFKYIDYNIINEYDINIETLKEYLDKSQIFLAVHYIRKDIQVEKVIIRTGDLSEYININKEGIIFEYYHDPNKEKRFMIDLYEISRDYINNLF